MPAFVKRPKGVKVVSTIQLHFLLIVSSPLNRPYILNKSKDATPELFAISIQNYANQECNRKCILMFKYWVMHNSKKYYRETRKNMKAIKM